MDTITGCFLKGNTHKRCTTDGDSCWDNTGYWCARWTGTKQSFFQTARQTNRQTDTNRVTVMSRQTPRQAMNQRLAGTSEEHEEPKGRQAPPQITWPKENTTANHLPKRQQLTQFATQRKPQTRKLPPSVSPLLQSGLAMCGAGKPGWCMSSVFILQLRPLVQMCGLYQRHH